MMINEPVTFVCLQFFGLVWFGFANFVCLFVFNDQKPHVNFSMHITLHLMYELVFQECSAWKLWNERNSSQCVMFFQRKCEDADVQNGAPEYLK